MNFAHGGQDDRPADVDPVGPHKSGGAGDGAAVDERRLKKQIDDENNAAKANEGGGSDGEATAAPSSLNAPLISTEGIPPSTLRYYGSLQQTLDGDNYGNVTQVVLPDTLNRASIQYKISAASDDESHDENSFDTTNTAIARTTSSSDFVSTTNWKGQCWYKVTNVCILNGSLTLFHEVPADGSDKGRARSGSLRMCNEFSRHSPLIRLKYTSLPGIRAGDPLPAPLGDDSEFAWILQFWCQDLFHMTLTLMPAFHTTFGIGLDKHVPDVFIRIAKGRRKKNAFCRIKLGDPTNYSHVRNKKWGGDTQFPFSGNPYWPFYRLLSPEPHRVYPLYPKATSKNRCYRTGIIDKLYVKDLTGNQARNYTDAMLHNLGVVKGPARHCGKYRLTLIDRRGKTRVLTNIPNLAKIADGLGFITRTVALEKLPIASQIRLMTETDVLIGMHGNGIMWLQFLPPGSVVVELIGVWYQPYARLWGHTHLHSSMKNNMDFKRGGEFKPFAHNETEVEALLRQAMKRLDETSCGDTGFVAPNDKLENLYGKCAPHC